MPASSRAALAYWSGVLANCMPRVGASSALPWVPSQNSHTKTLKQQSTSRPGWESGGSQPSLLLAKANWWNLGSPHTIPPPLSKRK